MATNGPFENIEREILNRIFSPNTGTWTPPHPRGALVSLDKSTMRGWVADLDMASPNHRAGLHADDAVPADRHEAVVDALVGLEREGFIHLELPDGIFDAIKKKHQDSRDYRDARSEHLRGLLATEDGRGYKGRLTAAGHRLREDLNFTPRRSRDDFRRQVSR
jgi:hypothetical protein